jgi:hypothetical protein
MPDDKKGSFLTHTPGAPGATQECIPCRGQATCMESKPYWPMSGHWEYARGPDEWSKAVMYSHTMFVQYIRSQEMVELTKFPNREQSTRWPRPLGPSRGGRPVLLGPHACRSGRKGRVRREEGRARELSTYPSIFKASVLSEYDLT